jgi:hypothetical protein
VRDPQLAPLKELGSPAVGLAVEPKLAGHWRRGRRRGRTRTAARRASAGAAEGAERPRGVRDRRPAADHHTRSDSRGQA